MRFTISNTAAEFHTAHRLVFFAPSLSAGQSTAQAWSTMFQTSCTLTPLDGDGTTTAGVRVSYQYTPGTAGSSVSTAAGVTLQ